VSVNGAIALVAAQNSAPFRIGDPVHLGWTADAVMVFAD
jgi:hypothetical protein